MLKTQNVILSALVQFLSFPVWIGLDCWGLSKGRVQKKSREFSLPPRPPPRPPSKVGNLFMIFFQHPRVKFTLFNDTIHNIWNQGKRGTRYNIEYFPKNCWVFKS